MSVSLKSLIGKLNNHCRNALEGAAGLCVARTHYDVALEHWLLKLAEMPDTDLQRLLRHYDIDQVRLVSSLTHILERFKTGNARTPALSPQLVRLISDAWMLASLDFGAPRIRSGYLLLALLENDELARLAREALGEFEKIAVADLHQNLPTLVAGSGEDCDSGMPEAAIPGCRRWHGSSSATGVRTVAGGPAGSMIGSSNALVVIMSLW
jgi:type VI secretion system protein VasG